MFRFAGFHITLFDHDLALSATAIFIIAALIIAFILYLSFRKKRAQSASIRYSDLKIVKRSAKTGRQRFRFLLTLLRVLAIAALAWQPAAAPSTMASDSPRRPDPAPK